MKKEKDDYLRLCWGFALAGLIFGCGGSEDLGDPQAGGKAEQGRTRVTAVPGELSETLCLRPKKSADGRRDQQHQGTISILVDPATAPCPQSLELKLSLTSGPDTIKVASVAPLERSSIFSSKLLGKGGLQHKRISSGFWHDAEVSARYLLGFNTQVYGLGCYHVPDFESGVNQDRTDPLPVNIVLENLEEKGEEETCVTLEARWVHCAPSIWDEDATAEEQAHRAACEATEKEIDQTITDEVVDQICSMSRFIRCEHGALPLHWR